MDLICALVRIHVEKQNSHPETVPTIGSLKLSKISWYGKALSIQAILKQQLNTPFMLRKTGIKHFDLSGSCSRWCSYLKLQGKEKSVTKSSRVEGAYRSMGLVRTEAWD